MTPSQLIKHIRSQLGYSQWELSKMLSINQCTLSGYERGTRKISIKKCYKLIKLAKLAGIEIKLEDLRPEE